ncbi:MAG: ABC transporter permease [Candidatus Rokubacteria bacterium]|nr:ABC transporter permease [Candidatus Rokubacteria bacterium]
MRRYVLRRAALAIPTLFLVSVIVFAMMRLMPGDVATRMVEGHAYAPTLDALRKDLGLDRPVHVQYLEWIGGILLRGDFGRSYWTRQPILEEFVHRFPVTLELAALTILISVVIGVVVGRRCRSRTSAWPSSSSCSRPSTSSGRRCGPTSR